MKRLIISVFIAAALAVSCVTPKKEYVYLPDYVAPNKISAPEIIQFQKLDRNRSLLHSYNINILTIMLKEYEEYIGSLEIIIAKYEAQIDLIRAKAEEVKKAQKEEAAKEAESKK